LDTGALVECQVLRPQRIGQMGYAWREVAQSKGQPAGDRALQWWLTQLQKPRTRLALLGQASTHKQATSV
jgi:hypothetical protein